MIARQLLSIAYQYRAIIAIASTLAIASFIYLFSNGMTNQYEEGVARVSTARLITDSAGGSLWQRYKQIGVEYLPLQTLLMMPLAAIDSLWRTGVAGSIISMIAFLISALTLYLLAKDIYRNEGEPYNKYLPAMTLAIFALNPSMLFLQATPRPESLFIATLVSAVYLLHKWTVEQTARRLVIAAAAMTFATLTTYEAWLVALFAISIVGIASSGERRKTVKSTALYSAIVLAGPLLWLLHNRAVEGNALEFLNAASQKSESAGAGLPKLLEGHLLFDILWVALAAMVIAGPIVILLAAAGFLRSLMTSLIKRRRRLIESAAPLLLLIPFVFQVVGLVRGSIEIFPLAALPLFNVPRGLAHLPMVALFAPASILIFKGRARLWAFPAACALIAAQYGNLVSDGPSRLAVYQEGFRRGVNARVARERAKLALWLNDNPPRTPVLMSRRELGAVVPQSKLNFSDVISENTPGWNQLSNGFPSRAQTVIVYKSDPLDYLLSVKPELARELSEDYREQYSVGDIKVFSRR